MGKQCASLDVLSRSMAPEINHGSRCWKVYEVWGDCTAQ